MSQQRDADWEVAELVSDRESAFSEAEQTPVEAMPPLSEEWRAEIGRRSDEFDAGLVQPIPWEQVHAESLRRAKAG